MSREKKSVRITKRVVDAIKSDGTDFYVFDSDLTGFGIRVRTSGAMTYIVRYRAGSGRAAPTKRVTIAKVGTVTPDQAREVAKDILASVVKGADPAKVKADQRAALSFAGLVDVYLAQIKAMKKPKTHELYQHVPKAYAVPALGKMKAEAVTSHDISKLHLSLDAKPIIANRVRNVISSMYGWAKTSKTLKDIESPAAGIEKYREGKRERFLNSDELQRLGAAIVEAETVGIPWEPDPTKKVKHAPSPAHRLLKIDPASAAALRLFMLTGARLREILNLTWGEVDLERGLLLLPDSKTGRKTIVLNAPAQLVLSSLPRNDRFVIPGIPKATKGKKPESRPRSDLNRPWRLVRKRAGLDGADGNPPVRIHDLRHTHASIGVGASFGLPIIGKLLGHTQSRTTERYAHLEADPLRVASEAIGQRIMEAMSPAAPATDNVVQLKK